VGFDGVIGSPTQPAIGAAPFSNVIVPDGEPVEAVTTAKSVTPWFVTDVEGVATSDMLLGPAACVSVV
jgi:hypothetical protein